MFVGIVGIIISVLITVSFVYNFAEPWVSCKQIAEVLNNIDQSDSTVLANKFFVRAVRFYTDRKVAVIDGAGKKFFSPHPLAFLSSDDLIKEFLQKQPVTYGIVRKATLKTLDRVVQEGHYRMTTITQVGDQYLVKIEHP